MFSKLHHVYLTFSYFACCPTGLGLDIQVEKTCHFDFFITLCKQQYHWLHKCH